MYAQILIAASLVIAGYYDVKERAVADIVWIPGAAGVVLAFVLLPASTEFLLVRLALIGGIGLIFAKYGSIGEADAIAFVIAASDPYPISPIPIFLASGVTALLHIGYLYFSGSVGKSKIISLEQFRSEAKWIPKAIVSGDARSAVDKNVNISREEVEKSASRDSKIEVQYGVPTVTYVAVGYLAYIVYMVLFHLQLLMSLA